MNVIPCKNYEEMSQMAARIVASTVKTNPRCVLGLATGSTPVGTYRKLAALCAAGEISFRDVTTFNLDEYYPIQNDNPQSYHSFMWENFFRHLDISPESVYILDGEAPDPQAECKRFEEAIRDAGGIDLQILGIGRNGHIGFNEPDDNLNTQTHMTALTEDTIDANSRFFSADEVIPTHALTVGMGTIMQAKKIVLLASGSSKKGALRRLLSASISTDTPATLLNLHPDVTVICDYEAYSDAVIGIDIGGMSAKVGLVENGEIIARRDVPIKKGDTAARILEGLVTECQSLAEIRPVTRIGVGTPGILQDGTVTAANLPFDRFPLKERLERALGCSVTVQNDANCAALGEMSVGAAAGKKDILMITLGTGIGAGIIANGKVYLGSGAAGEVGHMCIVPEGRVCSCGKKGCWEQYASASALIRATLEAAMAHPDSLLAQTCGDAPDGRTLFAALEKGCPVAKEVFEEYIGFLALGISNLIQIFSPEVVLLSGGISKEGDRLLDPLKEKLPDTVEVCIATLKNDAGIIGAAALVSEQE